MDMSLFQSGMISSWNHLEKSSRFNISSQTDTIVAFLQISQKESYMMSFSSLDLQYTSLLAYQKPCPKADKTTEQNKSMINVFSINESRLQTKQGICSDSNTYSKNTIAIWKENSEIHHWTWNTWHQQYYNSTIVQVCGVQVRRIFSTHNTRDISHRHFSCHGIKIQVALSSLRIYCLSFPWFYYTTQSK